MKVTPVPHGFEEIIGKGDPNYIRGAGLHMSAIYNDFYQHAHPQRYRAGTAPDPLRLETGLILENILEEGLREKLAAHGGGRPGELVEPEHGILFSPDLLIWNHSLRVGEIKLTWMSSREVPREPCGSNGFPKKFDKYFSQMMLYCRCLETPYARLIAFFVNGDYRKMQPELLAWDIEFSARELHEEWLTMTNWAKQRKML